MGGGSSVAGDVTLRADWCVALLGLYQSGPLHMIQCTNDQTESRKCNTKLRMKVDAFWKWVSRNRLFELHLISEGIYHDHKPGEETCLIASW